MNPYKKIVAARWQWLALAALALFNPVRNAAQLGDQPLLTMGAPIARELSGGQSHSYQITLAQGQYLEAIVEQRGIDVVVVVFAPDGKKVLEVDSPNDAQGPEPVLIVAETSGSYRLEVRSLEKNASVGRYDVRIEALRMPTEQDQARVAALRAFGEASQLRQLGTVEAVRQAVGKYEESLPIWHAVGDRVKEAETLSNLGFLYHNNLGETLKARDCHERELPLQRALGNQAAEAVALNNLGQIYFSLGEMQKALEHYEQSLTLRRAARNRHSEAVVLDHLGQVYSQMGQLQRALEYQQQALAIFRALNEPRHAGVALGNLSDTLLRMGEYERSLEYSNEALGLVRAANDKLQEAIFLNSIGVIYINLGEGRKAIDYYQQALALHRKSGNRQQEAFALTNMGVAFLSLSEHEQALDYLRQALPLHQAAGAKRGETATLFQLGAVYRQTGKTPQAKESFEAALDLSQAIESPDLEANIRDGLALVAQTRGDFIAARQYSEQAIELTESARAAIVGGSSRAAFLASKQTFYEHYIDLLMRTRRTQPDERNEVAALNASEQARARSLLELLNETRADIRQGVSASLLERERALKIRLTVRLDALPRTLSSKATEAQKLAAKKEVNELTEEYRQAQAEIRQTSPRYSALTQPQPLKATEIQQLLDDETLLLEYALGEKASYLWAVTPTTINSYALPPRAQIEQAVRQVYEKLRTRPARGATTDSQFTSQTAALSRMLLGPASAQLGKKRLAIVASGALAYLPFAALPAPTAKNDQPHQPHQPHQPLMASHEIVNLPSASVLSVIRRESQGRQAASQTLAVIADPVFEANDPRVTNAKNELAMSAALTRALKTTNSRAGLARLAFSRQEAEAIFAIAPRNATFKATDFTASRATATSETLSQYRMLHFATHGLLNNEQPELSGLVFSLVDEKGNAQDGFLRLHEVFNLKLNADLVVLSACETGLGKEIKGEGLIGLTRGFMYAGVPRVVASLWNVDDLATAELMKLFYRGMLKDGLRPAAALRSAQRELARQPRWAAPYFWAGFVLQGEWK